MDQPADRIQFERQRREIAKFVFGSAAFIAVGLMLTRIGDDWFERGMGWVTILFFGAIFLSAGSSLVRKRLVFVLDRDAITDARHGIAFPWAAVREVLVLNVSGHRFLALSFRDRKESLARASWWARGLAALNERMGWGEWTFTFAAVSPGIDDAVRFIRMNVSGVRVKA